IHRRPPTSPLFPYTTLFRSNVPYGTKGFVVMHKGGDGAVFKEGQATLAGWGGVGNEVKFQNAIGAKTGEAVGVVTVGDPANTLKIGRASCRERGYIEGTAGA